MPLDIPAPGLLRHPGADSSAFQYPLWEQHVAQLDCSAYGAGCCGAVRHPIISQCSDGLGNMPPGLLRTGPLDHLRHEAEQRIAAIIVAVHQYRHKRRHRVEHCGLPVDANR